MLPRLPSLTAASVALLRGIASLPGAPFDTANDASLRVLTPAPIGALFSAAGKLTARFPGVHEAARYASFGLLDHVALRTRAIDTALLAELERGPLQLVICGAGLDARAFRMPELRGTTVFEVDHPSTQRFKRARARVRPSTAKALHFVAVDFEKESLDQRLAEAGHDPTQRTVWIWEGVTPYLLPEATRATLEVLAARSAKDSLVLVTYALPSMVNAPELLLGPVHLAFRVLGEPLLGPLTTEGMGSLGREVGLLPESDTGDAEWARDHARSHAFPIVIEERLAALRKG